jgi:hypothetical protein
MSLADDLATKAVDAIMARGLIECGRPVTFWDVALREIVAGALRAMQAEAVGVARDPSRMDYDAVAAAIEAL